MDARLETIAVKISVDIVSSQLAAAAPQVGQTGRGSSTQLLCLSQADAYAALEQEQQSCKR